jgi:hypothetical protein
MIFIENKKAWKKEVIDAGLRYSQSNTAPNEYPCYLDSCFDEDTGLIYFKFYYIADLQRMVATIEKGKEF